MIQRKDLLARLRKGSNSRLILISGEPGSGKTSLVCQWIEHAGLAAAWYTLDADDNDVDLFLRYLLKALSEIDKALEPVIEPWLKGQQNFSIREITPVLAQHVSDRKNLYLVIDDYHLITNADVHDAVSHLLSHLPRNLHLVLITRRSLPFSVSSLRMRGQIMEITAGDLRLTAAETERFLMDVMSCDLSEQQMKEAFQWTEGWLGGLQLFGLASKINLSHRCGQNGSHPISQWMTEYLINEVIAVQEEKVRRFLLMTALLDRFTIDVCKAITGFAEAGEIIDHIYRNNLFLIPLDSEGLWYRYHHLLSDAVRRRGVAGSIDESRTIHRKASQWFGRNGYAEDALHHALATEDFEFAADMVEDLVPFWADHCELLVVRRWLNRIPKEVRLERALLMLYECRLCLQMLTTVEAEKILKDVKNRQKLLFARYSGDKRTECEDLFKGLGGLLAHLRDPLKADLEDLEKNYRELLPRTPYLAVAFKISMALTYISQGNMPLAIDTLNDVERIVAKLDNPYHSLLCFIALITAEFHSGRLRRVEAIVNDASLYLERKGLSNSPLRFLIASKAAWLFFYKNDLPRAERLAEECLLYSESVSNRVMILDAGILIMCIHLFRGRLDEAVQILYRVRPVASLKEGGKRLLETLLTLLAFLEGNQKGVTQLLKQRKVLKSAPTSLLECEDSSLYAIACSLSGRFQEAMSLFDAIRQRCVAGDMNDLVMKIDIYSSIALAAMGRHEQAKIRLAQVLAFAKKEGYVLVQLMAPLVVQQVANDPTAGDARHFLATIRASYNSAGSGEKAREDQERKSHGPLLSSRELEILGLIVQGYRNQEIAQKAFISLYTVKTHVRHILKKLNVETRLQAILAANELNLFDGKR